MTMATRSSIDEDICKLIVDFARTQVIGNEQQVLAVVLSVATGYAPDPQEFVASMIEGESSGGKSHTQKVAFSVFPPSHIKDMTSASDKAPIYSEDLRIDPETKRPLSKYIAMRLAEYQKLSPPVIEVLKSMSGDDPDFIYEVTSAATGNTKIYHLRKMPYNCTYAQQEKDKELQTRLFLIPVEENVNINRAVALVKLGKKKVMYNGREYHVHHDAELESRLHDEIGALLECKLPVECEFPDALIDMVNHSRPESKRHAQLISNLLKSSARLNWMRRKCVGETVYVGAQDVVNIISMFDLLQATMMGADGVDIAIYKYLRKNPGMTDMQLIHYLQSVGLTELTKKELKRRLDKLDNENYMQSSNTPLGVTYSANPHKQILTLAVDWEMIREYDDSPVVDPLTGVVYTSIVEYSNIATSEHTVRSGQQFQTAISEGEAKARGSILEHLSRPFANPTRNGVINGAIRIADCSSIKYFEVEGALQKLVDEGVVLYDPVKETYRKRYNELGIDTSEMQAEVSA